MRSLSKILLPVDFSERAAGAARYAKSLAAHFQSELILLHVLPLPQPSFAPVEFGGVMLDDLYRDQGSKVARELDRFLADELAGANVRRVVHEGDPATKIVAFAHDEAVDLIIMPTHGYGPFRRFILGSNTAKVLHDADCPVWTGVHLESAPPAAALPFRSILCAVDLGPQSEKAVAWAGWLQREFDAELTLLHATTAVPDTGDVAEAAWRRQVREAVEEELDRLQQATGAKAARIIVERGEPAQVICAAAAKVHPDLAVIGRGSAAGVFGRLRTNAYAIIRESPCPVVSV